MSNIAVYSNDKLSNDTSFVNNFLDDMIERYCSTRFTPNTSVYNLTVPTLDEVISTSYPGYYKKAAGLYASYSSTHVVVVYEPPMQTLLEEALEHKFSRLFVQADLSSNKLNLVNAVHYTRASSLFDARREMANYFSKRNMGKLKYQDLEKVLRPSKVFFSRQRNKNILIYKPDVNFARKVDTDNRIANEKLIDDLYFFDLSYMFKEGFNIELAFAIQQQHIDLDLYVSQEYASRMKDIASAAIAEADRRLGLIRDDIIAQEKLEAAQRESERRYQQQLNEARYQQELVRKEIELAEKLKREQAQAELRERTVQEYSRRTRTKVDENSSHFQQQLAQKNFEEKKEKLIPFIGLAVLFAIFILMMLLASKFQILG